MAKKKTPVTGKPEPKKKAPRKSAKKRVKKMKLPPAVLQPDCETCGGAAVTWALRVLGFDADLDAVICALHIRRVPKYLSFIGRLANVNDEYFHGTLPTSVVRVMLDCGYLPRLKGCFGRYIDSTVSRKGVVLIGYVNDAKVAHWIAAAYEPRKLQVAIMDPLRGISYGKDAMRHEAFSSKVRVMLGYAP